MVENTDNVPAIDKMNKIFDLLAKEDRGLNQTQISTKLEISKATVSRLVNTLNNMGYLEQELKTGVVRLGSKCLRLGNVVKSRLNLTSIAYPFIEALSIELDEMVKLSILRRDFVSTLISCESKKPLRITLDPSAVFPPYVGAAGKLLLALSDEGTWYVEKILPNIKLERSTDHTIVDKNILIARLNNIKKDKISFDNQEESLGIYAVAAPIYDSSSNVVAALSIPFFGDFENKITRVLPRLKKCAWEISLSMGNNNKEGHFE